MDLQGLTLGFPLLLDQHIGGEGEEIAKRRRRRRRAAELSSREEGKKINDAF